MSHYVVFHKPTKMYVGRCGTFYLTSDLTRAFIYGAKPIFYKESLLFLSTSWDIGRPQKWSCNRHDFELIEFAYTEKSRQEL